jgi:hypothetical protein
MGKESKTQRSYVQTQTGKPISRLFLPVFPTQRRARMKSSAESADFLKVKTEAKKLGAYGTVSP